MPMALRKGQNFDGCLMRAQIAYCEEQVECRRSVLLAHFGESFDVKRCNGTCDVCAARNGQDFEQVLVATTQIHSCGKSLDVRAGCYDRHVASRVEFCWQLSKGFRAPAPFAGNMCHTSHFMCTALAYVHMECPMCSAILLRRRWRWCGWYAQ